MALGLQHMCYGSPLLLSGVHSSGVVRTAMQQHHRAVRSGFQVGNHALKVKPNALGVKVAAKVKQVSPGRQGDKKATGSGEKQQSAGPPFKMTQQASQQAFCVQFALPTATCLYSLHSTPASAKMFLWLPHVGREM